MIGAGGIFAIGQQRTRALCQKKARRAREHCHDDLPFSRRTATIDLLAISYLISAIVLGDETVAAELG